MKTKILVICDDFYHHGETVESGLSFLQESCELTYATDMAKYSFADNPLFGYDLAIIAKDDMASKSNKDKWLTGEIEKQFEDYAKNGGGLIFLHAGSVICKHSAILKGIAGCAFDTHPEQCVVDFLITSPHKITEGAKNFAETDEHYFIDFTAEDAEIFLESSSKNGVQPAGYVRIHENKGRICVLTPGHNLSVFQNEQYKIIIKNAVKWCARTENII
ncbi:MAG: ThuA domain-containing protein [Oscillospiraceae bacterium]|nr:ThuA domain-containing protein [Oscillospiraceae bacterium]